MHLAKRRLAKLFFFFFLFLSFLNAIFFSKAFSVSNYFFMCGAGTDVRVCLCVFVCEGEKSEQGGEIEFHSWSVISWVLDSVRRKKECLLRVWNYSICLETLDTLLVFCLYLGLFPCQQIYCKILLSKDTSNIRLPCLCVCSTNWLQGFLQPCGLSHLKKPKTVCTQMR